MFKLTLLKHFMPIALSVCMAVQSLPAAAFAAEQSEAAAAEMEASKADADTAQETAPVGETTLSAGTDMTEDAQAETASALDEALDEALDSDEESSNTETAPTQSLETETLVPKEQMTEDASSSEALTEEALTEEASIEDASEEESTQDDLKAAEEPKTDAAVIFHDDKTMVSYRSVELEVELVEEGNYLIDYAPVSVPGFENAYTIHSKYSSGPSTIEFNGLAPDTEYTFRFYLDGNKAAEKTVKTKPYPETVTYDVKAAGPDSIHIRAQRTDADSGASEDVTGYEILDADDKTIMKKYRTMENDLTDSGSIWYSDITVPNLRPATAYKVKVWLTDTTGDGYDKSRYQLKEYSVTTENAAFSADDIAITIRQSDQEPAFADYSIDYSIEVKNAAQTLSGTLEYRYKGGEWEPASQAVELIEGKANGTLEYLQAGIEYEIRLTIGNVVKIVEYKFGEAVYTPEISADAYAFDAVLTYRLKESECRKNTDYTVSAVLYGSGGSSFSQDLMSYSGKKLTKKNNYTISVETAEYGIRLSPNTEYTIWWTLTAEYNAPEDQDDLPADERTKTYAACQTIHTKETALTAQQKAVGIDYARFKLVFSGMERLEDFRIDRAKEIYIKEENGLYRDAERYNEALLDSDLMLRLENLKADTSYTVSVRSKADPDAEYSEYGSFTFQTAKDNRIVRVNEVSESKGAVKITASLTGGLLSNANYLVLYFREKGTENAWEDQYKTLYDSSKDRKCVFEIDRYKGEALKEGTAYEYVIGVGGFGRTPQDKLKGKVSGEFTTKTDTRRLTLIGINAGYTYAAIAAKLTGNNQSESQIVVYYKEKEGSDWKREEGSIYGTIGECQINILQLKSGTAYEYVLVLDKYAAAPSPEDILAENKQDGEFTTKKLDYRLTFERDDANSTGTKETIIVKADGTGEDEELYIQLSLADKDGQPVDTGYAGYVTLKQRTGYKGTVSFGGLTPNTAYMLQSAEISVQERNDSEAIDLIAYNEADAYKFTTKNDITGIQLSEAELKLNLSYDSGKPYQIKAETTPANASEDVLWESSDSSVASVSDGRIKAIGAGEAVITASAPTNPEIKASCRVTVKDYAVCLTDGGRISGTINVKKGYPVTAAELYDMSDGKKLTPETDYKVSSSSERVAKWEKEGEGYGIKAYNVGYTNLVFMTADGYSAAARVHVTADIKGFGITGLKPSSYDYYNYPAIEKSENIYELAYQENYDISYEAEGIMNPKEDAFNADDFEWKSSNEKVVEVSAENGLTTKGVGAAEITVTPTEKLQAETREKLNPFQFTVEVKEVLQLDCKELYAVANTQKTLKDVTGLPEGWTWKEPDTPIYSLPENDVHTFIAAASEQYYHTEKEIEVRVGTITGVIVNEMLTDEAQKEHRGVLMVSSADARDSLRLKISADVEGCVLESQYTVNIPAVNGLTIEQDQDSEGKPVDGQYTITAAKAGKYTLKPEIKAGSDTVVVGAYAFKAVEGEQIETITLSAADAVINPANQMISLDLGNPKNFKAAAANKNNNKVSFDLENHKDFKLTAAAQNRNQTQNTDTKLNWTITDKSVAVLKVDKDTRTATVQVKGEGHAVIQVKAKDDAGVSTQLGLEVKNYAPRVEGAKATVNMAFDYYAYDDSKGYIGRELSRQIYGAIAVTSVYNESVLSVSVVEKDGTTTSKDFGAYRLETDDNEDDDNDFKDCQYDYVIIPKSENVSVGTYDCMLEVVTERGAYSNYPIKLSVINKKPKAAPKLTGALNLFYTKKGCEGTITLENANYSIESMIWEDGLKKPGSGFTFDCTAPDKASAKQNVWDLHVGQRRVQVKDGKLADAGADVGTLTIKLAGIKEEYTFDKFKVKWNYKKPALKTVDYQTKKNVSNMLPSMGITQSFFRIYDNLTKRYYNSDDVELTCDNEKIAIDYNYGYGYSLVYGGSGDKQEKVQITLDSDAWREPLTVSHTIKLIKPKAVLQNAKLTYHTNYVNEVSSNICMKDCGDRLTEFTDMDISGANDKAQALLNDDRLQIIHQGASVSARLNKLKFAGQEAPSGAYSYNLTPYYNGQALNTVKLTIAFTNKPITVKVGTKGALDLAQNNTRIAVTPKLSNIGSGYTIVSAALIGEYSSYFDIREDNNNDNGIRYLSVLPESRGRLKAGNTYKLTVVYTVRMSGGEAFKVTSNTFKVKPKQTAPKLTVKKNNQIMYAASSLTRNYQITVPRTYRIIEAFGSLDVNKDGRADLVVSWNGNSSLKVEIADRDAVIAAAKGKSYSIPVTVQVEGRDGISKDAVAAIKVNIKR